MRQFPELRPDREWERRWFALWVGGAALFGLVLLTVLAAVWTGIVWVWNHMG